MHVVLCLRFAALSVRIASVIAIARIRNGLSLLRVSRIKKKHIGWLAMLRCNILLGGLGHAIASQFALVMTA